MELAAIGVAGLLVVVVVAAVAGSGWHPLPVPGSRSHAATARSIGLGLIVAAGVVVLVYLLGRLARVGPIHGWDRHVHTWVAARRSGTMTSGLEQITRIGSTKVAGIAGLVLGAVVLAWARRPGLAVVLAAASYVEVELQRHLSSLVGLAKPDPATVVGPVGGFPSGGTARVALVGGLFVLAVAPRVGPRTRILLVVVASLVAYVEIFSRWYLGRHWVLDLAGGLLLGGGLIAAVASTGRTR